MFSKKLTLTIVLFVLSAFFVVTDSTLSQKTYDLGSAVWARYKDKQCGTPKSTSDPTLKDDSETCDFGDDIPENAKTACEDKSEEYEIKEKSPGCSVDKEEERGALYYTYFVCWEKEKIVEYGSKDCEWNGTTNECKAEDDFSITDEKFKFCKDGEATTVAGTGRFYVEYN